PTKEAILFQLQTREWGETTAMLENILTQQGSPLPDRLRKAVKAFFHSECAEARMRVALEDAAPLYREAPQTKAHRRKGRAFMLRVMAEALPRASAREQ